MREAKEQLQQELVQASAYIVQLEEKFYESQRTGLELLKEVKHSEAEVEPAKAVLLKPSGQGLQAARPL